MAQTPDAAWTPGELLAMARACIAALPDGHPAKITYDRLTYLEVVAAAGAQALGKRDRDAGRAADEFRRAFLPALKRYVEPARE